MDENDSVDEHEAKACFMLVCEEGMLREAPDEEWGRYSVPSRTHRFIALILSQKAARERREEERNSHLG